MSISLRELYNDTSLDFDHYKQRLIIRHGVPQIKKNKQILVQYLQLSCWFRFRSIKMICLEIYYQIDTPHAK